MVFCCPWEDVNFCLCRSNNISGRMILLCSMLFNYVFRFSISSVTKYIHTFNIFCHWTDRKPRNTHILNEWILILFFNICKFSRFHALHHHVIALLMLSRSVFILAALTILLKNLGHMRAWIKHWVCVALGYFNYTIINDAIKILIRKNIVSSKWC